MGALRSVKRRVADCRPPGKIKCWRISTLLTSSRALWMKVVTTSCLFKISRARMVTVRKSLWAPIKGLLVTRSLFEVLSMGVIALLQVL